MDHVLFIASSIDATGLFPRSSCCEHPCEHLLVWTGVQTLSGLCRGVELVGWVATVYPSEGPAWAPRGRFQVGVKPGL